MAGPNDNTSFTGGPEAPIARAGMGGHQANPNQHTRWDDGSGPRTKVRPVDAMLAATPAQECPKCGFKTHIEEDFKYHMKLVNGMTKCQRQRANFGSAQNCPACDGSGETATGVCSACRSMGKVITSKTGDTMDADTVAAKVSEALAPTLNKIADALTMLAVTNARAVKPKKQRKGKPSGSSRVDRPRGAAARPDALPPLESAKEPLGDPEAGTQAPE